MHELTQAGQAGRAGEEGGVSEGAGDKRREMHSTLAEWQTGSNDAIMGRS